MSVIDINFGMNSFYTYEVKIDYKYCKVNFRDVKGQEVCLYRLRKVKPYHLISVLKVSELLCQERTACWCYTNHTQYIRVHICSL